jgi:type IV secretion system protein VirD4
MSLLNGDTWTNTEEIKRNLINVRVSDAKYKVGGPPLISDGKIMDIYADEGNTMIIGSTGSSKTRGVVMQTLRSIIRAGESFVAVDAKAELYNCSHEELKRSGYSTLVLNFRELMHSDRWNPLMYPYKLYKTGDPEKMNKALELLNDIAINIFNCAVTDASIDPFWPNSARQTFLGLVEALFIMGDPEQISLFNVYHMFIIGGESHGLGGKTVMKDFFSECIGSQSSAYASISTYINAPNDTRASIASVFLEGMQMFGTSLVMKDLLSHAGFDLSTITAEKTAIIVIVPDESTQYHKLAGIFISQVYQQYIRLAHEQHNGVLPRRVNFLLEEFGNMRIPDAPAMLSACRSRNIRCFLVVQTLSQLDTKYGAADADVLKTNCILWFYFFTNHIPTLEQISKLCGERRVILNEHTYKEPLISVAQLQRFEPRQALIRLRGMQFVSKLPDISRYDYEMPAPAVFGKRKLESVALFDINGVISKAREEKMKKAQEEARQMTPLPFVGLLDDADDLLKKGCFDFELSFEGLDNLKDDI